MKLKISELVFLPIILFSSVLLLAHERRPVLWQRFLRPVVYRMRSVLKLVRVCIIGISDKCKEMAEQTWVVFNREKQNIIRLIRLDAGEDNNCYSQMYSV